MVLLTRAAFGIDAAMRYVHIAGLSSGLFHDVLSRPSRRVRQNSAFGLEDQEGRRMSRRD